jgi:hypothetical protein
MVASVGYERRAMEAFLHALISVPTVVFSVVLGVCTLYWLMVILGALDFDLLHHGDGGGHEAGHHGDGDGHGMLSEFWRFLQVGTVPITIVVSVVALIGWTVSMFGELIVGPAARAALPGWLWALALGAGALAAALPLAALPLRPLRRVFAEGATTHARTALVGRLARITSLTCDHRFGTATALVDGAELVLNVAAIRAELHFAKGDAVVIAAYDDERDTYLVGPAPHLAAVEAGAQPAASALPSPLPAPTPTSTPIPAAPPRGDLTACPRSPPCPTSSPSCSSS